jgi:hypothetical protein
MEKENIQALLEEPHDSVSSLEKFGELMTMTEFEESTPKRPTKEWKKCGRLAEWRVVRENKTIEEVAKELGLAYQTIQQWSIKYNWMEKRRQYEKKPLTPSKVVYDLLFTELMGAIQQQKDGTKLNKLEIDKLEKLVKMYKQIGMPFAEQVIAVMRVYIRYIETKTEKDSQYQTLCMQLVRDFIIDVESGFIHPEE